MLVSISFYEMLGFQCIYVVYLVGSCYENTQRNLGVGVPDFSKKKVAKIFREMGVQYL
jgi:hypothetical protein